MVKRTTADPVKARPQVSVIIPTYNRARAADRAVRSVLHQSYQDLEIIVVDDGSTDDTQKVIEELDDQRLRYIRHERNRGGSAARNTGIEAAHGHYIAFLDSDDEWLPQKLERQAQFLQSSEPSVGAVCAGFVVVDERGHTGGVRIPSDRSVTLDELFCRNSIGTASTVVVKRECFERVQFDPAMESCQDWDMWIRLAKRYKFAFVPEVLVRYHFNRYGMITANSRAVADGHLRIAQKYLRDADTYSRGRRAQHLFALGRRLVGLADDQDYSDPTRFGRQLLIKALRARPLAIWWLPYYFASFNKPTYRLLTGAKPRLRRLLARFRGNSNCSFERSL